MKDYNYNSRNCFLSFSLMHSTDQQKPVGGVAVLPMADLMKATKKRAEKLAQAEEEAAKKVSLDSIG